MSDLKLPSCDKSLQKALWHMDRFTYVIANALRIRLYL